MENKDQWCFAWVPEIPATAGKSKGAILRGCDLETGRDYYRFFPGWRHSTSAARERHGSTLDSPGNSEPQLGLSQPQQYRHPDFV